MPLVTLTVRKPFDPARKAAVLDAVHESLVPTGVPPTDRFHRVLELAEDDFRFDPTYPDAARPRGADFVLIEVLWSAGRSVKVRRQLLTTLMERLRAAGFDPEHVMVCFKETTWESWSFAGGRLVHA